LNGESRGPFGRADAIYGSLVGFLSGEEAGALTQDELETRLATCGRDLLRQLFQDHLDLRASPERRAGAVIDAAGVAHGVIEAGHRRGLATIVGALTVTRLAYRAKGAENLHLQDASLNLPAERHSHGLRALAATWATRGSYEEAQAAITRATGVDLGKRQVEELARRAAIDELVDVRFRIYRQPRFRQDLPKLLCLQEMEIRQANLLTQERMARIVTPTLIVWGHENPFGDVPEAKAMHHDIAGSHLVLFEQCGHWPQHEHPARFNHLAVGFLRDGVVEDTGAEPVAQAATSGGAG